MSCTSSAATFRNFVVGILINKSFFLKITKPVKILIARTRILIAEVEKSKIFFYFVIGVNFGID
jgi:hypothetical protein